MIPKHKLPHIKIDSSWLLPVIICCGFVVLYMAVIHFDSWHYIDDTWSVTQAYYYIKFGKEFDYFMGDSALHLAHFAKTYAFVYGLWAELFGWGRITHQILSVILAFFGAWLWGKTFTKMGASRAMAISFTIVLLLSIAFVIPATRTRGDSLVFFFGALAVWFAVHRYWFWATLVALISVETHPMGLINCMYVAGIWLISTDITKLNNYKKILPQVLLAGMLGMIYYLLLHYEHLASVWSAVFSRSNSSLLKNSFLLHYFWNSEIPIFRIHKIEILAFALSYIAILFFYHDRKALLWKLSIVFPWIILFADFLTPRVLSHYIIHAFPPLVIMLVYAWPKIKLPIYILPFMMAIYILPTYGYWICKNWEFYYPTYISKIRAHSADIESDVVIGIYAHWFAFNNNEKDALRFVYEGNANLVERIDNKYILWVNDYGRRNFNAAKGLAPRIDKILSSCPKEILSSFDYAGHKVQFEGYDCRDKQLTMDDS